MRDVVVSGVSPRWQPIPSLVFYPCPRSVSARTASADLTGTCSLTCVRVTAGVRESELMRGNFVRLAPESDAQ